MNYLTETDLICYAWVGSWADDERSCAFALVDLNNYRHVFWLKWVKLSLEKAR